MSIESIQKLERAGNYATIVRNLLDSVTNNSFGMGNIVRVFT